MKRVVAKSALATFAWMIGLGLVVSMSAGLGALAYVLLPEEEAVLFPITEPGPAFGIQRDKTKVCFAEPAHKLRKATPVKFEASIFPVLGGTIQVAPYPTDAHFRAVRDVLVEHSPGDRWVRHYCFELPAAISDNQGFTVAGAMVYKPPYHPDWLLVPQAIRSFWVEPLYPIDEGLR